MQLNDMDFFHQATKRICASLDIQNVLKKCLDFFPDFMPLDGITINIYEARTKSIIHIATAGTSIFKPLETTISLSQDASQHIEEDKGGSVEIINHPEKHIAARKFWKTMKKIDVSGLLLKLEIEDEKLGVVVFLAKGKDQYTQEHARRLQLLHDPFALTLANTLQHQEVLRLKDLLADDNRYLNRQLHHLAGDEIIGSEFGLKNVMDQVRQIAPQASQVLLLGETGTGKEVIANAIHYSSSRAGSPFITVNCGAIPDNLIDSALFGHEKGAFTGALASKRGLFERAHKGTLFMDEIGELPLPVQVRLLRVLQSKEIERVGGSQPIPVDIRIIAATHRDLPAMVREGSFREDLWYRLNVFPITIPPLRQRKSDILALTRYFLDKKAKELNIDEPPAPAPGGLERLKDYNWPGNVRELENLVERTIIRGLSRSPGMPLEFEVLAPGGDPERQPDGPDTGNGPLLLDDVTRYHIQKVLELAGGKVQGNGGAAELLGIHPNTLRNRMKKLRIPYGRNCPVKEMETVKQSSKGTEINENIAPR